MGRGGALSVAALVLYAVAAAMACRVPSEDPYPLLRCRRKRERYDGVDEGENVGTKGEGREDLELPNWLSGEHREREESEII